MSGYLKNSKPRASLPPIDHKPVDSFSAYGLHNGQADIAGIQRKSSSKVSDRFRSIYAKDQRKAYGIDRQKNSTTLSDTGGSDKSQVSLSRNPKNNNVTLQSITNYITP